jgi:predicted O-methyltransferase YrrM
MASVNADRTRLQRIYPDCWRWISLARRIPGQITDPEASLLFHLARMRTRAIDPVIVELGAGRGRASLVLAAGLCGKTRPRLFALEDSGDALRNLRRCGFGRILAAAPENWQQSWNDAIDILFVNAGGDRDFSRWLPFVKPGGIVAAYRASLDSLQPPTYGDFLQVESLAWAVKQQEMQVLDGPLDAAEEFAIAKQQDFVRRAGREIAEDRHAIEALKDSWSWRLTVPLRLAMEILQAMAGVLASFGSGSPKERLFGLAQWIRFGGQIRASGLLDERYYRDTHPGVAWAGTSPLLHFLVRGASAGDKPNELFDVGYYLGRYPDVARAGINPLIHYLRSGAQEGRDPHPHFDTSFYLGENRDVREAGLNPLAHYLAPGIAEGRDPNPWFDTSEYLEQNPDVAIFGLNPLVHQLEAWSNRRLCSQ